MTQQGDQTFPPLLILRHGETDWNLAHRMQGERDSPLTERGRAQAARQGEILRAVGIDIFAVVSSPQGRALHTAEIALARPRARIGTDTRLREIGIGRWTGLTLEGIRRERPDLFAEPLGWYGHAPGGETLAELETRVRVFLAALDGPTVVFTHGITSRMLRCCATGRPGSDFNRVEGGQGIVYSVIGSISQRLERPEDAGKLTLT